MPHDPTLVAETKSWVAKATTDLQAAEHALAAQPRLYSDSAFHCQQAAEEAMKGFLAWHNVPFRQVHSLEEIGEQCLQIEPGLRQTVDRAVPLTEYAWKFRHPSNVDEPTAAEARDALAIAHAVYQAVLATASRPGLEDAVEWRLGHTPEGREAGSSDDVPDFLLGGDGAKRLVAAACGHSVWGAAQDRDIWSWQRVRDEPFSLRTPIFSARTRPPTRRPASTTRRNRHRLV